MSAVQCSIDRDAAREDWLQREGSCPVKSTLLSWDQLRTANWRHRRHTTTYIDNIIIITNCSSCKLLSLYVYSLAWVFLSRLLVALKRAGCVGVSSKKSQFCLPDVQSDVLLLSHMHVTAFSIDQQSTEKHIMLCVISSAAIYFKRKWRNKECWIATLFLKVCWICLPRIIKIRAYLSEIVKWGFTDNELCDCGEIQTMSHIVNSCPLTKFDGGLLHLHEADEAAVDWLTTYGS